MPPVVERLQADAVERGVNRTAATASSPAAARRLDELGEVGHERLVRLTLAPPAAARLPPARQASVTVQCNLAVSSVGSASSRVWRNTTSGGSIARATLHFSRRAASEASIVRSSSSCLSAK
jgi:hypothetical protein